MAFLADGAYLLFRPGGPSVAEFVLPHRDIPDLWQWKLRLRKAWPGVYFWACRELVYSGGVDGASRFRSLSPGGLAGAALWTALVRPSAFVWKKVLKGFWRREVRDWEDALVRAWVVGIESNPGTVVGRDVRFQGCSVPLAGAWGELRPLTGDRIAVVAHYSADGGVGAEDLRSWRILREAGYQVAVSSTALSPETARSLDIDAWLVRPNVGHDFFSWRAALEVWAGPLSRARFLVLTNTSAVVREGGFLRTFEGWGEPVASVTGSLQIYPHAESYFWWFDLERLTWERLIRFFAGVRAWPEKRQLIHRGEIAFSRFLASEGLGFRSLFPYERVVSALKARPSEYPKEWAHWKAHDPINPSKLLLAVLRDEGAPVLKKVGPWATLPMPSQD